jgi:hypothetical protein
MIGAAAGRNVTCQPIELQIRKQLRRRRDDLFVVRRKSHRYDLYFTRDTNGDVTVTWADPNAE